MGSIGFDTHITEEQILALEEQSKLLEPGTAERQMARDSILQYTEQFLEGLADRKAYHFTDGKGKELLDSPIDEEGTGIHEIIDLIQENVDKPGLNPASAGHLGYIPGGGVYAASLGDYMAAVTNRYAGVFFASPGAVRMENMLVDWMCRMVEYPAESGGTLTSGGSIANLVAIVTARDAKQIKSRDVERAVIYTTSQVHHSVDKAIRIAGLGEAIVRNVALDDAYRMDATALEQLIVKDIDNGLRPFLIIASMGTTDVGAIDPVDEIGNIAAKYELWLHLDAAYGGFFMLCDEISKKVKGVNKADSMVMDPHKGLFIPYGLGAVLIKDKAHLLRSQYYTANYMQDAKASVDETSPADASPELSRHFRGMRLWLPLKLYGVNPFRAALEEKLALAQYFHAEIQKIPGFEVLNYPELSVVAFRYNQPGIDVNEFNRQLVEAIQKDGRVFLSSTTLGDKFVLRVAVLSFRTHLETVKLALRIIGEKVAVVKTKK